MNADVEKAVENDWSVALENAGVLRAAAHLDKRLNNFTYIADQIVELCAEHRVMAKALRDQEAEIARLRGLLGKCYAISGADTDGDPPKRHADHALRAVTDLRRDYDEVLDWQARCGSAESLLQQVVTASSSLLVRSDGRSYFESGQDTIRFRAALADITAHLGGENNG